MPARIPARRRCHGRHARRPEIQQTPPRFKGGVNVIQLDVAVLSPDGRPIPGLRLEDFTVLEDGRPQ